MMTPIDGVINFILIVRILTVIILTIGGGYMNYHMLMLENTLLYAKKLYSLLSSQNLSKGQPKVLEYLYTHDGCMHKDIANACMIEKSSVTSLLNKMERDDLIVRKQDVKNRRNLYVYLTEQGKQKAMKVVEAFKEMEEITVAGLDEDEIEVLLSLLNKINKNLKG